MVYLSMRKKTKVFNRFPDGLCVKYEGEYYYLLNGGLYYLSPRVLESWRFPRIVHIVNTEREIKGKMGFRPGTLISWIGDKKIYYIEGTQRRLVTDPDFLGAVGNKIILVSKDELNLHKQGEDL